MAEQMQRLQSVFGDPPQRTEYQAAAMMREWFHALSPFGVLTIKRAIDHAIATHIGPSYWPPLGGIVNWCRNEDDGWRDALGLKADTRERDRERVSDTYRAWRAREDERFATMLGGNPPSVESEITDAMCNPIQREPRPATRDDGSPPSPELLAVMERRRIAALREDELKHEARMPPEDLEER